MVIKIKEDEVQIIDHEKIIGRLCFEEEEELIVVTHTYVDESYRGKHLAQKLMEAFITYLEPLQKKCVPRCSYAAYWFQKHPEKQYLVK